MEPSTLAFWQAIVQILPVLALALVIEARMALPFVHLMVGAKIARKHPDGVYRAAHTVAYTLATLMAGTELMGLMLIAMPTDGSAFMDAFERILVMVAIFTVVFTLIIAILLPINRAFYSEKPPTP